MVRANTYRFDLCILWFQGLVTCVPLEGQEEGARLLASAEDRGTGMLWQYVMPHHPHNPLIRLIRGSTALHIP